MSVISGSYPRCSEGITGAPDFRDDMVEKVFDVVEGTAERRAALRRVVEEATVSGLAAVCKPVRCWRRSDLEAERIPRLTADIVDLRIIDHQLERNHR